MENNAAAVDRIHENRDLWFQAGGCDPDLLKKPTEQVLEHAQNVVSTLDKMLEAHGPQNGLDSFVEGLTQAVKKIKLTSVEVELASQLFDELALQELNKLRVQ